MRSLQPGLLFALALCLPGVAQAGGYAPDVVRTDLSGDTLQYQPAGGNWDEHVRMFGGTGTDNTNPAGLWTLDPDLADDQTGEYAIGSDESALRLTIAAAAAPWTAGQSLVADPATNTVWRVDPSGTTATLSVFDDRGVDGPGGAPLPLCSPVALATQVLGGEGVMAWFTEGAPPGTDHPFTSHLLTCGPLDGVGGVQSTTPDGDKGMIVAEGQFAHELPMRPVKGMAYTEMWGDQELFVVGGESPFGDTLFYNAARDRGRMLRVHIEGDEVWVENWTIIPDLVDSHPDEARMGQPRLVAPLSDKRLAIAGDEGIMVADVHGNLLDIVYVTDGAAPDDLDDVIGVLGLASNTDGTRLYALFDTGASGRKLAMWESARFAYPAEETTVCVDPGMDPDDGCEMIDEPDCTARCSTINHAVLAAPSGAMIRVPPGDYDEQLFVLGKSLTLMADKPGTVRLMASDAPAVQVYYNGPPGLTIDGFLIEGGQGVDLPYPDDASLGGGIVVFEAALTLRRTLVTGGDAYYGGGLAAIAPRELILEGVGFAGNTATYGGAMTVQGGWMQPTAPTVLGWTTIAGNTAHNKGGALCVSSTRLEVNSVILADNGEVPLCYLESDFGEMEASIAWSDLWPQSQWIVEEASDGESLNLDELGLVGDGMLNEDPKFEDLGAFDLHLEEGSLCINAGDPEFDDPDGTPSDMGMYGFVDWEEGDDDDSGPDDDDDVGPDDDDVMDDDDGDDDDSADIAELLPSGFRCDCSTVAGGSRAGWVLLLPLLALLRRR